LLDRQYQDSSNARNTVLASVKLPLARDYIAGAGHIVPVPVIRRGTESPAFILEKARPRNAKS
jgi:hypothetical protein